MKANEALTTIFVNYMGYGCFDEPSIERMYASQIEYIRKDAFIEKACDWFRRLDYDDTIPPYETTEEFIEGFKNAMKGE